MPGCREVVRHRVNGLLVNPRDTQSLAQAIEELLDDGELRRRMGVESRKIAEAEFSVNMVTQETVSLYLSLLKT